MPFRLNEFRAKIQFMTFSRMPRLITQAAKERGFRSNSQYINHTLCEALARDLSLDVEDLKAMLPPPPPVGGEHFFKKHESVSSD